MALYVSIPFSSGTVLRPNELQWLGQIGLIGFNPLLIRDGLATWRKVAMGEKKLNSFNPLLIRDGLATTAARRTPKVQAKCFNPLLIRDGLATAPSATPVSMRSFYAISKHLTFSTMKNVKNLLQNPANPHEHWGKHLFWVWYPLIPRYNWDWGHFLIFGRFCERGVSSF